MDDILQAKKKAALGALPYIEHEEIIGLGTGSTVECLLDILTGTSWAEKKYYVVSSVRTQQALLKRGMYNILMPNDVSSIRVYVDGADWIDGRGIAIKGYGGALFREKLLARMAQTRVAMVAPSKMVEAVCSTTQPIPIETIESARSYVSRVLVQWGARVVYREGMKTDQGNPILDIYDWQWTDPIAAEIALKKIIGVVESGLFAQDFFHYILS